MSANTKAAYLFESGVQALQDAVRASSSDREDLLIEAARYLDQAANLSRDDLGNSRTAYVQLCASARVACLSTIQCDSNIDDFISTSSVMAGLAKFEPHIMHGTSGALTDVVLESFWASLDQISLRNSLGVRKGLVVRAFKDGHWPSFETALVCSSGNAGMERLWYSLISIVLYQELSVDLPEKIIRCMRAMERTIELSGEPTPSFIFLGEHDLVFSQAISTVQAKLSMFPARISWLKSLADYYSQRLQSSFNASMQLYESNLDQYRHLKDAILTVELASEWTREIPSLSNLRFELLVARALALRKSFHIHHWTDDLEISAVSLREALTSKTATSKQLSLCKDLLADVGKFPQA